MDSVCPNSQERFPPCEKPALCCGHFDDFVVLICWGRKSVKERVGFFFCGSLVECNVYKRSEVYLLVARRCVSGFPAHLKASNW